VCTYAGTPEGHLYVMVVGAQAYSGVNLVATLDSSLASGTSVGDLWLLAGRERLWTIPVGAGSHTVTVRTSGGRGDVDLDVDSSGTDCSSTGSTTSEQCTVTVVGPATVSVTASAITDVAGFSLSASVSP
jgi:hypothetical protein